MIHNISKENIFDFLKANSIIEEVSNVDTIEVHKTEKNASLNWVIIDKKFHSKVVFIMGRFFMTHFRAILK